MHSRVKQLATPAWAGSMALLLLALLGSTSAYQGFDCGQGERVCMLWGSCLLVQLARLVGCLTTTMHCTDVLLRACAGTALLMLASHSQCGSSSHLACFSSFAMRVKKCSIKAWPHQAHKRYKPCMGIRLLANVTGGRPKACVFLQSRSMLQRLPPDLALRINLRPGMCRRRLCWLDHHCRNVRQRCTCA
jgi:hypothetical protein